MSSYMPQDTFNYGAAFVAICAISEVSDAEVLQSLRALSLEYQGMFNSESPDELRSDWVRAGEQHTGLARTFFDSPGLQLAFLKAFQWYVSQHDSDGRPKSLLKRVFHGAKFNKSSVPLVDRVKTCISQGTAYAIRVRMGTAPLPPR